MLYAKALSIGDKIGFFSPSSPATAFAPNRFQRAKAYLKAQGFELVEGSLTGKSDYYRSGSIRERAEELNQLIRDLCSNRTHHILWPSLSRFVW